MLELSRRPGRQVSDWDILPQCTEIALGYNASERPATASLKDSNRMPGGFALPADLERAMALDHIGLVKRVCTYAMHMTELGSDLVRHGLALCPRMKLLKQRFEVVLLTIDSVK
jgi:hypothetical protein